VESNDSAISFAVESYIQISNGNACLEEFSEVQSSAEILPCGRIAERDSECVASIAVAFFDINIDCNLFSVRLAAGISGREYQFVSANIVSVDEDDEVGSGVDNLDFAVARSKSEDEVAAVGAFVVVVHRDSRLVDHELLAAVSAPGLAVVLGKFFGINESDVRIVTAFALGSHCECNNLDQGVIHAGLSDGELQFKVTRTNICGVEVPADLCIRESQSKLEGSRYEVLANFLLESLVVVSAAFNRGAKAQVVNIDAANDLLAGLVFGIKLRGQAREISTDHGTIAAIAAANIQGNGFSDTSEAIRIPFEFNVDSV